MEEARPSRTALRVALRRAAHQLYDARPLVFDDPVTPKILAPYADEIERTPGSGVGRRVGIKPRPFSVGLRAFLVARSRYAEDLLGAAVTRGVRQYVLLGAGLDTFAHRNSYAGLLVFEVDHPATQAWKRELLAASGLNAPMGLTYAPVDFERESLAEGLAAAGFDAEAPAFFAWLGVVPYLTLEAFRATVRYVAGRAPGSGLVFDYGQPRAALPLLERLAHDSLAVRVEKAGEPFRLFFTPEEVRAELAGFIGIEDMGAAEINARYFGRREDGLRMMGSAGRMVSAWV
jgi:methyltransferase (TIGR00027 family)